MRSVVVALAALAVPASLLAQTPGTTTVPITHVDAGMSAAHKALLVGGVLLFSGFMDDAVNEDFQEWRTRPPIACWVCICSARQVRVRLVADRLRWNGVRRQGLLAVRPRACRGHGGGSR